MYYILLLWVFLNLFNCLAEYNIMVMELLGSSLEQLIQERKHFSLKTSLMVSYQMLKRIEYLHSKNFIHRDVKPDNFLIGRNSRSNLIYLIDFGLSKRFMHSLRI